MQQFLGYLRYRVVILPLVVVESILTFDKLGVRLFELQKIREYCFNRAKRAHGEVSEKGSSKFSRKYQIQQEVSNSAGSRNSARSSKFSRK
ncbi:hypothetical protein GJ496_006660 [Pomphorhynchus laevis]|nr:hypothetical protein GJ496_006660 [Pomphorhynchus laevis]